ncbi:Vesicle transport v-SNARE family protein isoform 2, partial [Theobroma cacao]
GNSNGSPRAITTSQLKLQYCIFCNKTIENFFHCSILHLHFSDHSPVILPAPFRLARDWGEMSQVFEGYERQYCELSANLTRKCASASALDGEQKKQKLTEIKAGLDDADALIRKMDLEARSLQPSIKATLLSKLREYRNDLNNLKSEVKRITSGNANQAARDELLGSGMADARMVSADQRGRLLMSTERLNQSTDRIKESRKAMLETEELGVSILQDLHQQRESLLHAHNTLHGVDDNISRSKKILTNMSRRMSRNKWIIGSIIAALVLAILFILYFKLTH